METFSWSDSLRALTAPCLDCLHSSKDERNDLEDLLADSGSASATTADAETLSLHSNPSSSPRRIRARFTKHIRLFGWDLFGRRQPIRLPDDDEEDEEENGDGDGDGDGDGGGGQEQVEQRRKKKRRSHRGGHRRPSAVTISSSTLDSDAAPLDSAAIMSHATNYAEEEVKRAERRRERRELKRAAALALEQAATLADGDEFEGFQGSGGQHLGLPSSPPLLGHDDGTRTRTAQDLRYTPNEEDDYDDDDDDDEGDFGAAAYTRRTSGSSDSGRGSDSRSRTSATTSVSGQQPSAYSHPHSGHSIQPYNHHYISQQPPAHTGTTTNAPLLPMRGTKNKSSRSSTSKSSSSSVSSTKRSRSSPSAPLSPNLASPVASATPLPTTTTTNTTITSSTAPPLTAPQETFEGFTSKGPRLQTAGIERQSSSGFPSPGIGGRRNVKRDMGAFLANRGDA
ncbi:hypothetical protein V8E52_005817 [Russula decolorans]|jgi:hypothetical protein